MSVGKKIVDGARAGIGSLLEKINAGEAPLSGVGSLELERELAARKALRVRRGARAPEDNPAARDAGGGVDAARRRAQAAAARARQLGAAKARRREAEAKASETARARTRAEEAAASEDSFRRFRDDVRSGRTRPGPDPFASAAGAGGGSSSARPGGGFGGFAPRNDKIAKAYKALDLPDGASFAQVKAQYRKLMRKYHPDMHTANPGKQKAATELSMQVTQAYNQLDEHLNRK